MGPDLAIGPQIQPDGSQQKGNIWPGGASFTPTPPNPRLHLRSPLPTGLQSLHLPRLLAQPFGRWSRPSFALHPPQASEGMLSLPTEPTEPEPSGPYDWGNLASRAVAVQALLTGTQNGVGVGAP